MLPIINGPSCMDIYRVLIIAIIYCSVSGYIRINGQYDIVPSSHSYYIIEENVEVGEEEGMEVQLF